MAEPLHFLVLGTDAPGQRELRERLRPAHRAWLREHPGHAVAVVHGGPTLDAQGTMNGTLLIVDAGSEAEVRAFVAADPYVINGLFAQLTVRRWAWTLGRGTPDPGKTTRRAPTARARSAPGDRPDAGPEPSGTCAPIPRSAGR